MVTKVVVDADPVLVETPFDVNFTIRNTGSADAAPFTAAIQEVSPESGGRDVFDPSRVDHGLAAGESVKVSISVQVQQPGNWKLVAIADLERDVDESNENDNSTDVAVKVLSGLPDLQWANGEGFSFTKSQTKPGYYDVAYDFINKGTADYAGEIAFISVTWYRDEDSASGAFPDVPIGDLAIDEERVLEQSVQITDPGTYTIYAYLDKDHVVDELNTDNNESSIKLTVE